MNERIKELAKQAEEYADIEYNASDLDWYELKEEKFAQLIVEECAQRAEAYAYMSQNFVALAEELRRMKQNG
jgi:hypothetical protein